MRSVSWIEEVVPEVGGEGPELVDGVAGGEGDEGEES